MTDAPVLGVSNSATGRRWRLRAGDADLAREIERQLELPGVVAGVLAARVNSLEEAELYLSPRLRDALPDPSHLLDMDRAIARVMAALDAGEQIAILADYDVDGATSGALLRRIFRGLGAEPLIYVPDREREGYGPNPGAMQSLKDQGASLVITVDCGATAFEAIDAANALGLEVIILDHHVGADETPNALAVVNPNRADETSPHQQLAAVGVCFLFAIGLNRSLRDAGKPEIDLMVLLDLVALGTVADVASLTGVNRALVAQGLKVMSARRNPGIDALLNVASVTDALRPYHLGFMLGPRINAGGRIGDSRAGLELLSTEDYAAAEALAQTLDGLNRERQEIEARVIEEATPLAEAQAAENVPIIAVSGEGWRQGVVGIVASRMAERFERPALVAAIENGVAVGSGRSVSGVDLGPAIIRMREAGLLTSGGGHAMAAGFRCSADGFEAFTTALADALADDVAMARTKRGYSLDGVVGPAASLDVAESLEHLQPFGAGNPEPRFVLAGVRLEHAALIKDAHYRLRFTGADGTAMQAMAFRAAGRPLGDFLEASKGAVIHLAGRVEIDTWRGGREARMIVEDAASAN